MERGQGVDAVNRFLAHARQFVGGPLDAHTVVHVVMGNEASDLDSMVSSTMHAYHRSVSPLAGAITAGKTHSYVPVINIPRQDFALRTESVWLFESVGVDTRSWVFIDEIDLDALHERGQLRLVLIDHNKLASHQKHLADAVEEIVDHHNNEHLYASSVVRRVVEPVGSAATLVALELLEAHSDDASAVVLDAGLARLLMGPILLDTVNFAADSARFNEKDTRAYEALKQIIAAAGEGEGQSPQALFDKLQAEKFNVASLSSRDLLRKDYKEFHLHISGGKRSVKLGISSVGQSIEAWAANESDIPAALAKWFAEQGLDLLLANTAFFDQQKGFCRQLVAFVEAAEGDANAQLFAELVGFLEKNQELKLHRTASEVTQGRRVVFYDQGNAKVSRKVLEPILAQQFFASL